MSNRSRAQWLLSQLSNCTDIVPGMTRREAVYWFPDDPESFIYGSLAGLLARDLKSADAPWFGEGAAETAQLRTWGG